MRDFAARDRDFWFLVWDKIEMGTSKIFSIPRPRHWRPRAIF